MFKLIFWSTHIVSLVALFALSVELQMIAFLVTNIVLWALCFLPPLVYPTRDLPMGAHGLALPGLILIRPEYQDRERLLSHEFTHIKQLRRWSPLGLSLYMAWHYGPVFFELFRGRHQALRRFFELYKTNPLEREANEAMEAGAPYTVRFSQKWA